MEKIKGTIINAKLLEFTDEKSGELVTLTKVNYVLDSEDTDNSVGYDMFECNLVGNVVRKFRGLTMKPVTIGFEKVSNKTGYKLKIREVNGLSI